MDFEQFPDVNTCYFPQCDSTNDAAFKLLEENEGIVIWTLNQTRGRGSRGRNWWSPKGSSLAYTIGWASGPLPSEFPFPIFAGVAAHAALCNQQPSLKEKLVLKWPNDLICQGKKLGGILCESRWMGSQSCKTVIGVGLNIHDHLLLTKLEKPWTSLENEGFQFDPKALVADLTYAFKSLTKSTPQEISNRWVTLSPWNNHPELAIINGGNEFRGTFLGLTPTGGIRLQVGAHENAIINHPEPDFLAEIISTTPLGDND